MSFRKQKGGIKLDSEEEELDEESDSATEYSEEETEALSAKKKEEEDEEAKKAKEEAIWAAFKTDVQSSIKTEPASSSKGQKVQCMVHVTNS